MYNKFYGLKHAPFNLTPDPRFIVPSTKHREAINHMLYGIVQRKGFIQLTGEVGTGKTTMCRQLLDELSDDYRTALILNPSLTEAQLMRSVLAEFGLKPKGNDRLRHLQQLNEFLLELVAQGQDAVLIIDEAQDLTPPLLEQVRLLSNLETDQRKLLQIVLIGQPELRDMLNQRSLRQLRQRITVRYHLNPLTRQETDRYICHRLHMAGGNGTPQFSRPAVRAIHRYARGIPRLINAACDKSLLAGYVAGCEVLTRRIVRRAIRELEGRFA